MKGTKDFTGQGGWTTGQQRGQRMLRAVIARIHDDEFAFESVRLAETRAARGIGMHMIVVRPRRHDRNFFGSNAFGRDAVAHEPIQRDNPVRPPQTETRHPVQQPARDGIRAQPARRDGFVRINAISEDYRF